jgi:hypothetical protein
MTDFLAALFLKDTPEDLLINLNGRSEAWGKGGNTRLARHRQA